MITPKKCRRAMVEQNFDAIRSRAMRDVKIQAAQAVKKN
jgi:hypothetical protein